jgi:protein-disulfide isomerase
MSPTRSEREDKKALDGLPKKDRQALARELARIRREEERKRKHRNKVIIVTSLITAGVLALAGGGWATYNAIRSTYVGPLNMLSDGILFTSSDGQTTTATTTAAIQPGASNVPSTQDMSQLLVVTEYVDYASPDVAKFETTNGPALQQYVTEQAATLEIHPVALDGDGSSNSYSTRAANTMACVANTTPDAALAVHNALVAAQPSLPSGGLSDSDLVALATKAGATDPAIASCINGNDFDDWVQNATNRAKANVPNSDVTTLTKVPMVVVDGQTYTGALDDSSAFTTFIGDAYAKATTPAAGTDGSTATPTPDPSAAPTP